MGDCVYRLGHEQRVLCSELCVPAIKNADYVRIFLLSDYVFSLVLIRDQKATGKSQLFEYILQIMLICVNTYDMIKMQVILNN